MKNEKEGVDFLLKRNAAEQLAGVDWDELNAGISSQLDRAQEGKTSVRKYSTVFKIGVGVAAAAALLFVAVRVGTDRPWESQVANVSKAVVKLVEPQGSASVEIIDLNGELEKDTDRPSWIIVSRPPAEDADDGASRDMMAAVCLF